jgi:DNA repair exonuclease SbcCD nuclease subunit
MRFVVFSDLHLHEWSYGSTLIEGRNSRLSQQVQVVQDIQAYCVQHGIENTYFCGDLFHAHTITPQVSQASYEAFKGFKEKGIALSVLAGNHDQLDRSGSIHSLSFFSELGQLFDVGGHATTTLHSGVYERNGTAFHFLPYTDSADRLRAFLSRIGEGIIFLHQGVGGVEVNSKGFTINEILRPDMINPGVAMAFSGHYHTFKQVSENLIIPGSTMQLNWGDEGEPRGWLDVTTENGVVIDVKLIQSSASRFVTIDEGDFDAHAGHEPLPNLYGNFVRVISGGDYSPEELQSTVLSMGAVSCEVKPDISKEKHTRIELTKLASFNEVIYSFANTKEKLGVITEHDKEVGEKLLKEAYALPQI